MHTDALIGFQAEAGEVAGAHEDDIAAVLAAIEIVLFVDYGVELTFGADGHDANFARAQRGQRWNRFGAELRFACRGSEFRRARLAAGNDELLPGLADVGDLLHTGDEFGDEAAEMVVIACVAPVDR